MINSGHANQQLTGSYWLLLVLALPLLSLVLLSIAGLAGAYLIFSNLKYPRRFGLD